MVTVAIIVTIIVTVFGGFEAWPLTSFRLFSGVRTGHSSSLSLVAITADGRSTPINADSHHIFVKRAGHLYHLIPARPPAEQRAMVDAWLDAAGMSPADYATVELRRTSEELDPAGGPPRAKKVRTVATVDLHP